MKLFQRIESTFSYISGEKQIKMQGLPLVKSKEYNNSNKNKAFEYCQSSAKMLVKGIESSVNIQMSYEAIYIDCADCSFGAQETHVYITAEILFAKHYGVIQFTLDGTEVWQLKED